MKTFTVIFAIVAVWWMHTYCLSTVSHRVPIIQEDRIECAYRLGKKALPFVIQFNSAIDHGLLPPDTTVYGFWLEDHRGYADFPWIGGIYGYADHYEFLNTAEWDGPEAAWAWLRSYDVDYLVYRRTRHPALPSAQWQRLPIEDPKWDRYFKQMYEQDIIIAWELKRYGDDEN